jgi:hypothetical protein
MNAQAIVPRPEDAFYLDVTYPDGKQTRFTIDALDEKAAFYETAFVLGGCGDIYVPEHRRNPHGALRRTNGDLVAEGDAQRFEEASA